VDNRTHNCPHWPIPVDVLNEVSVNLDLVWLKFCQQRQPREARFESIDRHADACSPEAFNSASNIARACYSLLFGDLDDHLPG